MMRRSVLKQGKPLERKSPMSRASSKTPAAGAGLLRVAAVQAKARAKELKLPKPVRSRGMKGRPPTAEEARFMSAVAALGCVACKKDGWHNPSVSVHHIDGRTKPGAHLLVLPLCAGHHQDGTGANPTLIAVHPYKARFEERYGAQRELLAECVSMLTNNEAATVAAGAASEQITVE
ncbi:Ref family recombination enhancement nuclease [Massilia sp. DD77]|uniref:Ref family recombination enhancement nuclease n=1 Tax=Massilia sp. DD77 TaxID=3109349 RepID=UPI002FFEF80A